MTTSAVSLPIPRNSSGVQGWTALAVLMGGTFMIVLDFFIVNVALPSMQRDLRVSTSAIEWVVAGYSLTFATFLVTAGRLGDLIRRRRTFSTQESLAIRRQAGDRRGIAMSLQNLAAVLLEARPDRGDARRNPTSCAS